MRNCNRGFALIDIILAITIITVALTAIGGLYVTATKSYQANDVRTQAYKLAQARLEALKSCTDAQWKTLPLTTTYQPVTTLVSNISDTATKTNMQTSFVTNTTPAVPATFTLATQARLSPAPNAGTRLVEVQVVVTWQKPTPSQIELITLFSKDS